MSQTPLTDSEAYDVGGEQHPQGSVVSAEFARWLERQIFAIKHDIEAYRGALGYAVSGNHDGRLVDGTVPKCGLCNSQYALNAKANYESWLNDSSLEKWFPITAEEFSKIKRELSETQSAFDIQRKNYTELYDAVIGGGCVTSDFKDVVAIAREHREENEKLKRDLAQSEKSNLNLRAFIQELESHQQGLLNELDTLKHRCAELSNSKLV